MEDFRGQGLGLGLMGLGCFISFELQSISIWGLSQPGISGDDALFFCKDVVCGLGSFGYDEALM